jgi:NADH/F420H2 dehydrogenase subunit C
MDLSQVAQKIREKLPDAVAEERPTGLVIKKESLLEVAKLLKDSDLNFENCHCITGVDWKDKMEVVYHFYTFKHRFLLTLKVFVPLDDANVETISGLWRSADWLEREVYDLFGIKFLNHPDLRRILNPDEWDYYPLRKNFTHPEFFPKPEPKGLKG